MKTFGPPQETATVTVFLIIPSYSADGRWPCGSSIRRRDGPTSVHGIVDLIATLHREAMSVLAMTRDHINRCSLSVSFLYDHEDIYMELFGRTFIMLFRAQHFSMTPLKIGLCLPRTVRPVSVIKDIS